MLLKIISLAGEILFLLKIEIGLIWMILFAQKLFVGI